MTQRIMKSAKKKKTNRGPLILIGLGVILVIVAAVFAIRRPSAGSPPASFTPDVKGAAAIRADKEKVDLGDMKLGATADVSFTITNTGDQPLRFTKQPYIEVKEGCWPPDPAIGSMALNPGESTTVELQFMMHGDMGGKHDFRVHLPTNDPKTPDLQLTVLSNWIP